MEEIDFITGFHNLQGDLISERKKNLNKLTQNLILYSNEQRRNDILKKLEPKTYQENLFYVDTLIHLKQTEKLTDILKTGNQPFAKRILKQYWFCKETFKNIEIEKFVHELLPCLPFNIRMKILNKLPNCYPEELMDNLFDALNNKYSLNTAIPVLHKCSSQKIKQTIEENNQVKLTTNQMIHVFDKNKDILEIYLEHFKTITRKTYNDITFVQYVALKNPSFLLNLQDKNLIKIKSLGKRSSKYIIKILDRPVFKNITRCIKFLNKAVVVKMLGPDFEKFYKESFPKKISPDSIKILEKYPRKRRWELFYRTCTEKFSTNSEKDILLALNDKIKILQPPQEIIYKWAQFHYEKRKEDYKDYLLDYPVDKAIDILKKESLTNTKQRTTCFMYMARCCKFNNDLDALEDVLKYLSSWDIHEPLNRYAILTNIEYGFNNLDDLNEVHWKYLNEQIDIQKTLGCYNPDYFSQFTSRNIQFLVKNRKITKDTYITYIKDNMKVYWSHTFYIEDASVQQEIYTGICKVLPEVDITVYDDYVESISRLINEMMNFSLKNPNHFIHLAEFPEIVSIINSTFKREHKFGYQNLYVITNAILYNETFPEHAIPINKFLFFDVINAATEEEKGRWLWTDVVNKFVFKENRDDFSNKVLEYCINSGSSEFSHIVPWFLKNEPRSIIPYFDTIIKNSFNNEDSNLKDKRIKQYSHLRLDKKVTEQCMKYLDEMNIRTKKTSYIIEVLYPLLTTDEFIKLIENNFLPLKGPLNLEDQETREFYKVQCDLVKQLKNVDEPYKMLPIVTKFLEDDYLRSVLPVTHSILYKSPENSIYCYIEELAKQLISVKKLSLEILDKKRAFNILKILNTENTNNKNDQFLICIKYFLKCPSQDLFDKVIETMNTFDKNNTNTLNILSKVEVPKKYKSQYFEKCWYTYEHLEANDFNIDKYLGNLIKYLNLNIYILKRLSSDFLTYIIKKYFTGNDSFRLPDFEYFIINVLKDQSTQMKYCDLIFELMAKNNNLINSIFKIFSHETFNKDDRNFVTFFSECWYKHFPGVKPLNLHIALKLILLKLDSGDIKDFANSVVKYMEEQIVKFGSHVISIFKYQTNFVLTKEEQFHFCLAVLNHKVDIHTCSLVLKIINGIETDDNKELNDVHKNIMDILNNVNIPIISALLGFA